MLDLLLISILIVVAAIWTFVGLSKFVRWVDSLRPREIDWVARRKRKISRNGFKSRMGAR
jgi:uncharacterized protein involved in cysteine biosynthesis